MVAVGATEPIICDGGDNYDGDEDGGWWWPLMIEFFVFYFLNSNL